MSCHPMPQFSFMRRESYWRKSLIPFKHYSRDNKYDDGQITVNLVSSPKSLFIEDTKFEF